MTIEFTRNERPTVGVELELHVVDAETGDLVSASTELLKEMGAGWAEGEHPKAKHELFQSTIEIITGVCDTPAQAEADLQATLDELRKVAESRGLRLLSSGTHPFGIARQQDVSPDPRYHDLVEAMQWPARRLLICGMHIHVGVLDGQRAITIINELKRQLPIFLALSSSSPFFEGEDSGLASARSKVFESLPTAGLPPQLEDWVDFEAFMSTLLDSECISSIREVWWDIRPHPDFGTIEFRMCDATQTLREARALTGLAQTLVTWCDERIDTGELPPTPARVDRPREPLAGRPLRRRRSVDRRGSGRWQTTTPSHPRARARAGCRARRDGVGAGNPSRARRRCPHRHRGVGHHPATAADRRRGYAARRGALPG